MKKLRTLNNENGYFKFIITTGLIAFAIYAGIQFGMPYYRYSSFKSDATELARICLDEGEKTRTQIFERAKELKLPIKEEKDIEVTKTSKGVRVKTAWSETVDILGLYQQKLDFTVNVEA